MDTDTDVCILGMGAMVIDMHPHGGFGRRGEALDRVDGEDRRVLDHPGEGAGNHVVHKGQRGARPSDTLGCSRGRRTIGEEPRLA